MFIEQIQCNLVKSPEFPFGLGSVHDLMGKGLVLKSPVTILTGENGVGKSTLLEAVAEAMGLDSRGGHGGRRYRNSTPTSRLAEELIVLPHANRNRADTFFLRAETALGVWTYMSEMGVKGYGSGRSLAEMSHGESVLDVLRGRFDTPGLYLLDEPEAGLSFSSMLVLAAVLTRLGRSGGQVICATHSPVLCFVEGSSVFELDSDGIHPRQAHQIKLIEEWECFFARPAEFMREVLK